MPPFGQRNSSRLVCRTPKVVASLGDEERMPPRSPTAANACSVVPAKPLRRCVRYGRSVNELRAVAFYGLAP